MQKLYIQLVILSIIMVMLFLIQFALTVNIKPTLTIAYARLGLISTNAMTQPVIRRQVEPKPDVI